MTTPRDPDRLIRAFLAEGPTDLPDRTYDAIRSDIERTRQRVVFGPWRLTPMNTYVKLAIAAAAVVVVAVVGINLLPAGNGQIGGPGPSPSPAPSPSPTPTPSPPRRGVPPPGGPALGRQPLTSGGPRVSRDGPQAGGVRQRPLRRRRPTDRLGLRLLPMPDLFPRLPAPPDRRR